jgi:hypothetical protein
VDSLVLVLALALGVASHLYQRSMWQDTLDTFFHFRQATRPRTLAVPPHALDWPVHRAKP